jgi:hypothetical protein
MIEIESSKVERIKIDSNKINDVILSNKIKLNSPTQQNLFRSKMYK